MNLKCYKNKSKYFDNMNIRRVEDHFAENAQGISKKYHEVFLLTKFLQTKPQIKKMNINYYDLFYTVIKKKMKKKLKIINMKMILIILMMLLYQIINLVKQF